MFFVLNIILIFQILILTDNYSDLFILQTFQSRI